MTDERPKNYAETVREVVENRVCLKFSPKDKIPDIIARMHAHGGGVGGVVNEAGKFIGFITEREIVRSAFGTATNMQERLDFISNQKSSEDKTAWDIMIASADTLHPEDHIEDAVDVIDYFGYRYMPVVDSQNNLIGIADARELHRHDRIRAKNFLETKDSMLSYVMGTEPYGKGASF
tara:strand:+ start:118 stop:651 length:534 start_codon:yes stop_codon:yes gene_type:complete